MRFSRSFYWPTKAKYRRSFSKMTPGRLVSAIFVLSLFFAGICNSSKRTKRELRFPKGSSFVVAVAVVTFLPKDPSDGFAHFVEFDLGFPFPDSFTTGKTEAQKKISWNPSYKKVMEKSKWKGEEMAHWRGKRNLKEKERRNLIWKLEDAINRLGFNGASCMSRFRCELRYVSPENSLLEKLLIALFRTSDFQNENCEDFISTCPISLLHAIIHSQHISDLGD